MSREMISLLLSVAFVHTTVGATINVPANQPTIQAAINIAAPGDLIAVAPGTYAEKIDFLGKTITVRGTGGATVTTINATGLAGSVVTFASGEDPNTVLEGFRITGGTGTQLGGVREGGGVYLVGSDPTIRNCLLTSNTADLGGGIYGFVSNARIIDCALRSNLAPRGAAIYNDLSNPIVINGTLSGNSASIQGGGMHSVMSTPRLINCVVWGNTGGSFSGDGTPIVTYSDIAGAFAGVGNINADPMFVDPANGDLRLMAGSPCIDAGDSTAIASSVFVDLAGSPRGVDDPTITDLGIPVFGLTVDMGAYERQVGTCPADVTQNGVVDINDLLVVIDQWGVCPGPISSD